MHGSTTALFSVGISSTIKAMISAAYMVVRPLTLTENNPTSTTEEAVAITEKNDGYNLNYLIGEDE